MHLLPVFEGKDPINLQRTQAVSVAEQSTVMSRPEREAAASKENQKMHGKFIANAVTTGQKCTGCVIIIINNPKTPCDFTSFPS